MTLTENMYMAWPSCFPLGQLPLSLWRFSHASVIHFGMWCQPEGRMFKSVWRFSDKSENVANGSGVNVRSASCHLYVYLLWKRLWPEDKIKLLFAFLFSEATPSKTLLCGPRQEAGYLWCLRLSGISAISDRSHCSIDLCPLLYFCLVLLLFLSYPVFCLWPILLTYFSLNLHFPNSRLLCVALVFCFSWAVRRWIFFYLVVCAAYAAIWHLKSIFSFAAGLFLSILFFHIFNLVLKHQTETVNKISSTCLMLMFNLFCCIWFQLIKFCLNQIVNSTSIS